jgi:ABC-type nitrate/sulfonate/bicarbonate transport system substrate-binding protein
MNIQWARLRGIAIAVFFSTLLLSHAACERSTDTSDVQQRPLAVQFGWIPDTHHAGFWLAKNEGLYAEQGLAVRLLPGGSDASPLQAIMSGAADIAQLSGPEQLVRARADGLPIVGIAVFHRTSPHAIISTERNPISTPSDLVGARVAVAFGDTAEINFEALKRTLPLEDAAQIEVVPFRFDLTPLLRGRVDAITGFSTDQPATIASHGMVPIVMSYTTSGIRSYGYLFAVTEKTFETRQRDLEAFLEASRLGWLRVFDSPDTAVSLMVHESGNSLDAAIETQKLQSVRELMEFDEDEGLPEWRADPDILHEVMVRMLQASLIDDDVQITELFRYPSANQ